MKTSKMIDLLETLSVERGRAAALLDYYQEASPTRRTVNGIDTGIRSVAWDLKHEINQRITKPRGRR